MRSIFGTRSERQVRKIEPIIKEIDALGDTCRSMRDSELRNMTPKFKERLAAGETLDDILPEAFAVCREACERVLGLRPYRVQLIGGIILHQGRIAEMRTGEGKTLVATLPAYLNALTGEGVHVITVNDYLAKRDSEWMGKVYRFLGLTVGLIVDGLTNRERRIAYAADITYGTNNEFGFDYLRDNMAMHTYELVQRPLPFAIVDEVDSILIDEARTPLIISGGATDSTYMYQKADIFARDLKPKYIKESDSKVFDEELESDCDYIVEEKNKSATLTMNGIKKAEAFFGVKNLSDIENTTLYHHINQAIKARGVMKKDIDYVVKDGEVVIVDESTGRLMFGRRYNEGLHQAIEAKESVNIGQEMKTLATVTFQNFFRLYKKLSGMTGTAMTEKDEFQSIYKLDIVEIPTNRPVQRIDMPDLVYKTAAGKYCAVVKQIKECYKTGQPILIGTSSIEKSELISKMLIKEGIPHNVLNAKNHEQEAEIVAQAGKLHAVTVATNMAGRGTDILLGGNAEYLAIGDLRRAHFNGEVIAEAIGYAETHNEEVLAARKMFAERKAEHKMNVDREADKVRELGGLFILGTERHESRRIDNQLRGRAGRQGDVGISQFFLSLDDDTLRIFGSDKIKTVMDRLAIDEDTPIHSNHLSRAIENAQKSIESRNFQIRKTVIDYDDVMNTQREVFYADRKKALVSDDIQASVKAMVDADIEGSITSVAGERTHILSSEFQKAIEKYRSMFIEGKDLNYTEDEIRNIPVSSLISEVKKRAHSVLDSKSEIVNHYMAAEGGMNAAEREVLLSVADEFWIQHLDDMDELKQSIKLRSYAQEDPVVAYKRASFDCFESMINSIKERIIEEVYQFTLRPKMVMTAS